MQLAGDLFGGKPLGGPRQAFALAVAQLDVMAGEHSAVEQREGGLLKLPGEQHQLRQGGADFPLLTLAGMDAGEGHEPPVGEMQGNRRAAGHIVFAHIVGDRGGMIVQPPAQHAAVRPLIGPDKRRAALERAVLYRIHLVISALAP